MRCIRYLSSKNQRERSIDSTTDSEFKFLVADGTAKLSGRDYELRENPLQDENKPKGAKFSMTNFKANRGESQLNLEKQKMTLKPVLKFIDATKSTHTDLDVMQEKRVHDCWNADSNRFLSDSWKGFTKITRLKEKPPNGSMWSRGRIDKSSNDFQTRSCMARIMDQNW